MGHLRKYALIAFIGIAPALAPGPAAAAPPAPTAAGDAEGRAHFGRGQGLFNAKRYVEAARAFEAGYAASGRPQFLYNIGQAYRRANEHQKAKDAYTKLLELDPNTYRRKEVEVHLQSIEDTFAAQAVQPAPSSPSPVATPAPPPVTVLPSPAPPPAPPPGHAAVTPSPQIDAAAKAAEAPDSDSIFRRPWFWVVVGGLVAAGTTAAVFAIRSDGSSCDATRCVTENRP